MKMVYVGADVHQTSTTLVALDHRGKVMKKSVIRTTPELLISELRALGERVVFAAEESNHSRWLYDALEAVVEKVIICDPKRNKFGDRVQKTDRDDAYGLAELCYMGKLKPIYHGDAVHTELKELVKAFGEAKRGRTRAMNAIRGVLANDGTWGASSQLFAADGRESWIDTVGCGGRKVRLRQLFARFDLEDALKCEVKKQMVQVARHHSGWRYVNSVPGLGDVRTSQILAIVGRPVRFRTRSQFWMYCGLGVVFHETDQYDANLKLKTKRKTLGLNRNRNPILKDAFKGAAQSALMNPQLYPEITDYFVRSADRKGESVAKVMIARKLAAITLNIWKRKEEYSPEKASW